MQNPLRMEHLVLHMCMCMVSYGVSVDAIDQGGHGLAQ